MFLEIGKYILFWENEHYSTPDNMRSIMVIFGNSWLCMSESQME